MNKKKIYWGLACLGILAAALGSCFFFQQDTEAEKSALELSETSSAIRKFYSNRPGYWGLNTENAIANKLVPASSVQDGKITNALGAGIKIGKGSDAAAVMPGLRGFDIIWSGLSQKACLRAATYAYSPDFLLGVTGLSIENEKGNQDFGWGSEQILPLSKGQAKKACGEKENTLIWHME